jgi:hypothetical protein
MHYLPLTVFRPKDHRNPQSDWGDILTSANLGPSPFHSHDVGKLRSYLLLYDLVANYLAISELRCGTLHSGSNLIPSMRGRAKGVIEGYVVSMGVQPLHRLGVPFDELPLREVKLLNYLVKIIYRRHLEITPWLARLFSLVLHITNPSYT